MTEIVTMVSTLALAMAVMAAMAAMAAMADETIAAIVQYAFVHQRYKPALLSC